MAAASQFFPISSSPQWKNKPTTATTATSFSLNPQFNHKRPNLSPLQISLSDTQTAAFLDQRKTKTHNPPPTQARKNPVWINPNSKFPKEALLAMAQQPERLIRLTNLASSLDKSEPSDEAVSAILSAQTFPISEADVILVIDNMACAGNTVFALRWFLRNIQLNKEIKLYNVTFKALRKINNWPLVESLWEEMLESGTKPNHITFTTVISCARQCNLPAKAVEWYEKMPGFGFMPDKFTMSTMMAAYWHVGQFDKTLELYNQARTFKGGLFQGNFRTMIVMYAESGNFDGALNVFEEMKALGLQPNLVTCNVLLHAMSKAGRPSQVKTIYTEMCNNGVVPNRSTYAALIRAYSRGGYSKDALATYRQMKDAGMELDVNLYNMLLSTCADNGLVEKAEEMLDEMKKLPEGSRLDSWSYSSLITAYSYNGQVSEAERLLNEMLDAGIRPNYVFLTSLIQCYVIAKQTEGVARVIGMLSELQLKPDDRICGCLLNVATNTPAEEFGKIVSCIDRVNPNVGSFVKLLLDENSSVRVIRERATELLDVLREEVKKPYFNCLMDICVNHGKKSRARELFDLAVKSKIYCNLEEKQEKHWILQMKGLSYGAALMAMHGWMDDVSKVLKNGGKLPPLLGINTGHGKHRYGEKKLVLVLKERLREMNAPFNETPDQPGCLLTSDVAAKSWIEGAVKSELVFAV